MRQRISNIIFNFTLFLLPWQTVFLYARVLLPEGETVYGHLGFYATEGLIIFATVLRGFPKIDQRFQKVVRALFWFVGVVFLSLAWSSLFAVSFGLMIHLFVAGLLFVFFLDERTNMIHATWVFLFGLVVPSFLGWFQFLTGWSPGSTLFGLTQKFTDTQGVSVVLVEGERFLRAHGSFPHPNVFGGYLAIAIFIILMFSPPLQGGGKGVVWKWMRICFGSFLFLFTSTLILTFSRSAWLAIFVLIVSIFITRMRSRTSAREQEKKIATILFGTIVLFSFFLFPNIASRFDFSNVLEARSIEERVSQYAVFPSVFLLHPWIGSGPGTYPFALAAVYPNQPSWSYQPIHNTFLLLLAEIGVLGFIIAGYFLWEVFRASHSVGKILIGALLMLVLFDHYLFSSWSGLALVALVFALSLRDFD